MFKKKIRLLPMKEVHAEERESNSKTKKVPHKYVKTFPDKKLGISDVADLIISCSQTSQDSDPYIDIRTWLKTDKYNGPTKKGINFNSEYLDELIEMLVEVRSDLKDLNL